MAIPEAQLETWSRLGAIATSLDTYAAVKRALETPGTGYSGKAYEVFLQGSYGNDTNVYAESDVDVVIRLDDLYFSDTLPRKSADAQAIRDRLIEAGFEGGSGA